MFRLISKEPYIDKTRIGVYGKVRRTYAAFTALWGCVSVGRVGHPITKELVIVHVSVSLGKILNPKMLPMSLEARCMAAAAHWKYECLCEWFN